MLTNKVKQDESGAVSTKQVMGKFKAVIEVEIDEEKKTYEKNKVRLFKELKDGLTALHKHKFPDKKFDFDMKLLESMEGREQLENQFEPLGVTHLHITQKMADILSDVFLQQALLNVKECIVRVYMIKGESLSSRDAGSESDPYLILAIGDTVFNERDNYQLDEPNPGFYKSFDFVATLPGCPQLILHVMDYDDLFGDDLIGTTYVDLEDRYFLPEWRAINDIPIEYRQLYHPSSNVSQGVVKMWVEIKQVTASVEPPFDIKPKPPYEVEVRVVIWDTRDIKMMDVEGTSDVFIKAFFDSKKALETDTHFRCQTGKASFNYRLKFNEV